MSYSAGTAKRQLMAACAFGSKKRAATDPQIDAAMRNFAAAATYPRSAIRHSYGRRDADNAMLKVLRW